MTDVSVCLITYNHKNYIGQALDSILMQQVNFQWEIVIADDCSTDGTGDIIKAYELKHPGLIRVLNRPQNIGPGKNFCELIEAAKGKYIAYLEGDDYWASAEKLKKQYDYMVAHPGCSLCYHQINWVDEKTEVIDVVRNISNQQDRPETNIVEIIEKGWFIRSCSMFFKNIGLPKDFDKLYIGDFPLHIILAYQGTVHFIKEPLAKYRINYAGISESKLERPDYVKRKKLFRDELFMFDYLNQYTQKKHNHLFNKKKNNIFYTHMLFVFRYYKKFLPGEFFFGIRKINFFSFVVFVVKNIFKKKAGHET